MEGLKLTDGTIARHRSSAHLITQSCFWGQLREAAWTLCFRGLCKSLLWIKMKYCSMEHKKALTAFHEAPRVASPYWRQGTSCGQLFFNLFRSQPHFRRSAPLASYWGLISPLHPSNPGSPAFMSYGSLPPQEKRESECMETHGDLSYGPHSAQRVCLLAYPASEHWYVPQEMLGKDRIYSRIKDKNRKILQGQRLNRSFAPWVAILPVKNQFKIASRLSNSI